jgi:hypothetical protein
MIGAGIVYIRKSIEKRDRIFQKFKPFVIAFTLFILKTLMRAIKKAATYGPYHEVITKAERTDAATLFFLYLIFTFSTTNVNKTIDKNTKKLL